MNKFTDRTMTDEQEREFRYNLILDLKKIAPPFNEEELNEEIAE